MLDFVLIASRVAKNGVIEIYPKFKVMSHSSDIMIRGGDFYAVWVEEKGLWSTDEQDVLDIIDHELKLYSEQYKTEHPEDRMRVLYLWDSDSGMIDKWHKYAQKQMRDHFVMLDEKVIFSNDPINKLDYASKRLPYPLESGECPAWDKLIGTLYSEPERHKIEWAIGAIVSGESKHIQKFEVFYGAPKTGKSTILDVISQLFEGYFCVFDAKALGSSSAVFALDAFRSNPLVAIQHDGDLSKIEDNTRLNSLVSHEMMIVNEKYKSSYQTRFKCFLFMGTNKPVKITDGKSGLLRRLIDVHPSGNKLNSKEYKATVNQVKFELGRIASHCLDVYLNNPDAYDDYIPIEMMGASNDFYNFVLDNYSTFKTEDCTTLKTAWELYKLYCDEAKVPFMSSKIKFKEELKNYFLEYFDRVTLDGIRVRSYYKGFKSDIFDDESDIQIPKNTGKENSWIELKPQHSLLDDICKDCPAQYSSANGTPIKSWDTVTTTLKDIETDKTHYVRFPIELIFIDFDKKNKKGEKDLKLNLKAAAEWPPTYAEVSQGGHGLHLYYYYAGNVDELANLYSEDIEIKKCTGKSSARRKVSLCNDIPIATLNSGLPIKEVKKVYDKELLETEKTLRKSIEKALKKDVFSSTRQNVDFIGDILDKAYNEGIIYDLSDMKNDVIAFAARSTNQSDYCLKRVSKMQFHSDVFTPDNIPMATLNAESPNSTNIFFDVEVAPNHNLVCWKFENSPAVVAMLDPKPWQIEELIKHPIIGFNNRNYDNHILHAILIGYSIPEVYALSNDMINEKKGATSHKFGPAYSYSKTDIFDFAAKKQSLKKWEIELDTVRHHELGIPWDSDIPDSMLEEWIEYCKDDVRATEAVFKHLQGDYKARCILAELAGLTPNDTTNACTTKFIFGNNKHPELVYTRLESIFPGYEFVDGKNMYMDTDLGFGGYVYAEPGMYGNVALIDVASMHPASIIAMNCFGDYTQRFKDIRDARVMIKHKDFDGARKILDGKLAPYLDNPDDAKQLAQALKIAINSVYGLTSASFDNPFRDKRNVNNIVALRGALFMRTLQDEVQKRGYRVVHIKTDSIKIADADKKIIDFCMDFAKKYQYEFEHEATYDRMTLVNDAEYIAKYATEDKCKELYGYIPKDNAEHGGTWTATGIEFQVPYVFKTLFSKEPIEFKDLCETKSVSTALYLSSAPETVDVRQPDDSELHFIGKVGLFCPMLPDKGRELLRRGTDKNGNTKYSSANGAKGFKWLESEVVKSLGYESFIDRSYYDKLANDAIDDIRKYGDYEWFISNDPYIPAPQCDFEDILMEIPWKTSCGKDSCFGCPAFSADPYNVECRDGYDISDVKKAVEEDLKLTAAQYDVR